MITCFSFKFIIIIIKKKSFELTCIIFVMVVSTPNAEFIELIHVKFEGFSCWLPVNIYHVGIGDISG